MAAGRGEWHWVNLPGGNHEEVVADLCELNQHPGWVGDLPLDGVGLGRGCLVVQTNATSAVHVVFSGSGQPSRGTDEPVLRFVVGKRRNSMTSVGFGNPYLKKEPIDFTRNSDALLTKDAEKSKMFWFLYDRTVGVAAMGALGSPHSDVTRLATRFGDSMGFRAEVCEGLRYISVASGRHAVSLRVVGVGAPPDVSIPRFRFDPLSWQSLPWYGASLVFEPDEAHRRSLLRAQGLLAASPLAPFYGLVDPGCFCLSAYRLLDPHRRGELFPGEDGEEHPAWEDCFEEVHRRLTPILQSGLWTYWPLKYDRSDVTSVGLVPTGPGCTAAIGEWCRAVQAACGLRNGALSREMFTITFAFEVFPVVGEEMMKVRREVAKEIAAIFEQEWATMEFRSPALAAWRTHADYDRYEASEAH